MLARPVDVRHQFGRQREQDLFAHPGFLSKVDVIVAELHGSYRLEEFNQDLAPSGLRARVHPQTQEPNMVLAHR